MSRLVHRLTTDRHRVRAVPAALVGGHRRLGADVRAGEGCGRHVPAACRSWRSASGSPRSSLAPFARRRDARARAAGRGVGGARRRPARGRLHACRRSGSSGRASRARASSPACTSSSRRCSPSRCFRIRIGAAPGAGSCSRPSGSPLLAGVHGGAHGGNLLVLGGAAVYSLQIVLMERYAPRYDALGFTLARDARRVRAARVVAVPTMAVPRGWTVWGALLVTGHLRERARVPRPDLGAAARRARRGRPSSSRSSRSGRRSSASGSRATGSGAAAGPAASAIMAGILRRRACLRRRRCGRARERGRGRHDAPSCSRSPPRPRSGR